MNDRDVKREIVTVSRPPYLKLVKTTQRNGTAATPSSREKSCQVGGWPATAIGVLGLFLRDADSRLLDFMVNLTDGVSMLPDKCRECGCEVEHGDDYCNACSEKDLAKRLPPQDNE